MFDFLDSKWTRHANKAQALGRHAARACRPVGVVHNIRMCGSVRQSGHRLTGGDARVPFAAAKRRLQLRADTVGQCVNLGVCAFSSLKKARLGRARAHPPQQARYLAPMATANLANLASGAAPSLC